MCQLTGASITKYHRSDALNNKFIFSQLWRLEGDKIKVLAHLVSFEDALLGL